MEHEEHDQDQSEHKVYGGEIPDEGQMDVDIEMSRADEIDEENPNSKENLEEMKKRLKEIEEEAGAFRGMQAKVEKEMGVEVAFPSLPASPFDSFAAA